MTLSRFLNKMFWTFFSRMEPASSMEKPACIQKTRAMPKIFHSWLIDSLVVWETMFGGGVYLDFVNEPEIF